MEYPGSDMVFEENVDPHPLQSQRCDPSRFLPLRTNEGHPQRGHDSGAPESCAPSSRATAARAASSTARFSSSVSDSSWSSTSLSIQTPFRRLLSDWGILPAGADNLCQRWSNREINIHSNSPNVC